MPRSGEAGAPKGGATDWSACQSSLTTAAPLPYCGP